MSLEAILQYSLQVPYAERSYWRLDSSRQTLVFSAAQGIPECLYWGTRLPDGENPEALLGNQQRPIPGASLDIPVPLSLCPEESQGWPGQPGLDISTPDGQRLLSAFRLESAEQSENTLTFVLSDQPTGLRLTHTITLNTNTETIKAQSTLEFTEQSDPGDHSKPAIRVDWLSAPVLPVPDSVTRIMDFAGRWCGEFQPQTTDWQLGIHSRESREGRTGHAHVPLLFCGDQLCNSSGEVYGWHLGWSGGHRMLAEEINDGRRQVQFGVMHGTQLLSAENPLIQSPPLYMSYSAQGLNEVAQSFHATLRQDIVQFPDPTRPRPVHYNCWEAIYFDHDVEALKTIASGAAKLGVERFVLDDGWFKARNHDRAALGDWVVDEDKYPEGLHPLIQHIHAEGMTFGLWFEPEMINADSDLYRAHPEWVLGPADGPTGRQQMVLDLSQDGVCDYLFSAIDKLLSEYPIEYIKWDHNRVCIGSTPAQTYAVYQLFERLNQAHPTVEIESCSSGGGRIDFGILQHTKRVWLSDSNDALERWRIQHEAALLLPPEITGSHVGPRHCHTSGRVLPMSFRAWVAASRHMGLEMDVRELSDEETSTLSKVIAWWKANRDWLFKGCLHRLDSSDPAVIAEMTVAEDSDRFVVFAAQMVTSTRQNTRLLRLTGLEAERFYCLKLQNTDAISANLTRYWASDLNQPEGLVLSGLALMRQGIGLPIALPSHMIVIEGTKLK